MYMQAVILAAGRGMRMMPLTSTIPKPLLRIGQYTLLDYTLRALPSVVDEIILVVGYHGEQIVEFMRAHYPNLTLQVAWQREQRGTAHALLEVRHLLKQERFFLLFADDLHSKTAIASMLNHDMALLVAESEHPEKFGVVVADSHHRILSIIEKPEHPPSSLVNVGVHLLDSRIFNYVPQQHTNGEYYLTTMIDGLIRDHAVFAQLTDFWFPIGYPDDLLRATFL